jgi:hypothetical protein
MRVTYLMFVTYLYAILQIQSAVGVLPYRDYK